MKRFISFVLAFVMIVGTVASAAPRDIIHRGKKVLYKHDVPADQKRLVDDIIRGFNLSEFYKEIEDNGGVRQFVNIVERENAQEAYMMAIMQDKGYTTPEQLREHMLGNASEIQEDLKRISEENPVVFDADELEEYFGSNKAPLLKSTSYSLPVPGSDDCKIKITKLVLPEGASKWVAKVDANPFTNFETNTIVADTSEFKLGEDFLIKDGAVIGEYLFLGAVDESGQLKAYASIEILDTMFNKTKIEVIPDGSLTATVSISDDYSGHTVVSGDPDGETWKIAVLNAEPGTIYTDSKFNNAIDYENGMELPVLTDNELDVDPLVVQKFAIIYSVSGGEVTNYKVIDLDNTNVSGLLTARELIEKLDDPANYNYTLPVKGDASGTTQIKELKLPDGGSAWSYVIVHSDEKAPIRHRVYEGDGLVLNEKQDITIPTGKHLMILANDANGKVIAYAKVEIETGMIKDPLANEIKETINYTMPLIKGDTIGTTAFKDLYYDGKDLYYVVSENPIDIPEKDLPLADLTGHKPFTGKVAEVFLPSDEKLKDEDGFTMNLMIYAVDSSDKIIASTHKNLKVTPANVKLPPAGVLDENLYSISGEEPLKPGVTPNSTVLKKLDTVLNRKYNYKFVDAGYIPELNEIVTPISKLEAGKELRSAFPGKELLILLVDNSNRTKEYARVPLTTDNTRVGNAPKLIPGMNYKLPEPGTIFESTRFMVLGLEGLGADTEFWVHTSDSKFNDAQLDKTVSSTYPGATKYTTSSNISPVDSINKRHLILLAANPAGEIKAYQTFVLTDSNIRGTKAKEIDPASIKIVAGSKPGTIIFDSLSNFGIGNTNWRYKWIPTDDDLVTNPPYTGQVIENDNVIDTKNMGSGIYQGTKDIKVEPGANLLLLATNGKSVLGYKILEPSDYDEFVQATAPTLVIDLEAGENADSTKIIGSDAAKAKKYIISTVEMPNPAPNEDLPKSGVKDVPVDKNITIKIGEHLRIYHVDGNNKILGFKDFEIESDHIKQGSATLSVVDYTLNAETKEFEVLEGSIRSKLLLINIKLENAQWEDTKKADVKNAIVNGLKSDGSEQGEWGKVLQKISDDKFSVTVTGETLTIRVPATEDYDISNEQRIRLEIPAKAIVGAINPIDNVEGEILIKPTVGATISGSIVNNINQSQINSGAATIKIDLADGKWIDSLTTSENIKKLLDGFTSNTSNDSKWNSIRGKILDEHITLTSTTSVQITIPESISGAEVEILSPEKVSLLIDKDLVEGAELPIPASPSFTIYPDILPVSGIVRDDKVVKLEAPDYKNALVEDGNFWTVDLDGTTFKDGFSITKDLTITNLPPGLKLEIKEVSKTELSIKLLGKSNTKLGSGNINLIIKSSAVEGINYSDSKVIPLKYDTSIPVDLKDVGYKINNQGIYLDLGTGIYSQDEINKLEFSVSSVKGPNIDWTLISSINIDDPIYEDLEPITLHVREKAQPNNKITPFVISNPNAPEGVFIETYEYINENELKVTLNTIADLQYNLSVPDKWETVTGPITLDKDSKLIVRFKERDNKLPSKVTPQLNGLFLGGVKLDVSQSKIMGANRNMKYKLSADASSWSSITTNDPTIAFKEGNEVWISDAKDEKNKLELGTVIQATITPGEIDLIKNSLTSDELTDVTKKGIYYHLGERKIINKTGINLQYNITKGAVPVGNWYNLTDAAENVNFVAGNVFVRKVDNGSSLPSNPIKIFEIADPINPPKIEVNQDNKALLYESSEGVYEKLDKYFEYKIGNGDYQSGDLLEIDPQRYGNVKVYVKRKATKDLLTSKEVDFTFTENISLANVRINVAEGVIEGTTTKMEYRTDSDYGNPTSPWKTASNTNTEINMYEGMNIWVRELGKTSTSKELLKELGQMDPPITPVVGKTTVLEYKVSQGFITNHYNRVLEYRINDDSWKPINVNQTISIEFVPTKLSIRTKATADKLASDSVNVMENDLDYPETAPEVDIDDKDNKVSSIGGILADGDWTTFEFKLKSHTEWMPGENLKTFDLSGDKVLQVRKRGSATVLPSEITEVMFTKDIDLTEVKLNATTPLKLIATSLEMEYQVYLEGKPVPNKWIKASAGTTNLDSSIKLNDVKLIVIRDSRNIKEYRIIKGINNIPDDGSYLPVDLGDITYKITSDEIVFTVVSDSRLQYKLSPSTVWKDFPMGDTLSHEITEITVKDKYYPLNTRTITVSERTEEPKVKVNKVEYIADKIKLTLDEFNAATMEYLIDKGAGWIPFIGTPSEIVEIDKNDLLAIRAKAIVGDEGTGKLPSLLVNLNTNSLINVGVIVDPPKLTNTTQLMEYSFSGNDGTWKGASNSETPVATGLDIGATVWIREIKNTGNLIKIGPLQQDTVPSLDNVNYNIAAGEIENASSQDLEYRMNGGSWLPINEDSLDDPTIKMARNVKFVSGPLEFRKMAKGSYVASKPKVLATIRTPGSEPKIKSNDIDNTVEMPDNKEDYQYRITIDGATSLWSNAIDLENENLSGNRTVEIRKIASKDELASNIQKIKFTNNQLKQVNLSAHIKPLELNGTTAKMEYMINNSGKWLSCMAKGDVDGNTRLMSSVLDNTYLNDIDIIDVIVIRYKEPGQEHNIFIVYGK